MGPTGGFADHYEGAAKLRQQQIALVNCDIYAPTGVEHRSALLLDGPRIAGLCPVEKIPRGTEIVDLNGACVAPGFIDLQVNGGGGLLFSDDPSDEVIAEMVRAHQRYGTTSMLPTYITGPDEGMRRARSAVEQYVRPDSTSVLGIHFEGPSISAVRAGVHNTDHIRSTVEWHDVLLPGSLTTMVTLAPEAAPTSVIRSLAAAGARVAAGHSNATYDESARAFRAGVTAVTHLFNAMSQMTGREPGLVGAALADRDVYVDFIPDGHHVHFGALAVAIAAKEKGRAFIVTDAMPPVGSSIETYSIGSLDVRVVGDRCETYDGVLAGSTLDMASAVRRAVQQIGVSKVEAFRMASTYPADYLGRGSSLGRLAKGFRANAVICTKAIEVLGVVQDGSLRMWV